MLRIITTLFAFMISGGAVLASVTVAQLNKNSLWIPESTKVRVDLAFTSGEKVRAGQSYKIYELEGNELRLWFPNGKGTFSIDVKDSTLLEDAAKRFEALKPEQRELSPALIAKRKDIWPLDVTINRTITYDDGSSLRKGSQYTVTKLEGDRVQVYDARKNMLFNVSPSDTDFYEQCIENAGKETPSRLYREIARNVRDARTLQKSDAFLADGGPEYIAVYYAASWCPYCAQTSPEVMEWYKENEAREKKQIQMLLISHDKNQRQLQDHVADLGYKSWLIPNEDFRSMIVLRNTAGTTGLPYLFVIDREGNLVVEGGNDMPMERTQETLAKINALQAKLDKQEKDAEPAPSEKTPRAGTPVEVGAL